MRCPLVLLALVLPAPVGAQVVIDSHGVRSGGMVIDSTGVHGAGGSVTRSGVRRGVAGRSRSQTIATNGGNRAIDCGGGTLTVNGNANRLRVAGCAAVTVAGNGNTVSVAFGRSGRLTVAGNRNTVGWRGPRNAAVSVSDIGAHNGVTRVGE